VVGRYQTLKPTGAAGSRSHFAITYICLIKGDFARERVVLGAKKMAFRRRKGGVCATI